VPVGQEHSVTEPRSVNGRADARRPTLEQVAELAGVSRGTASRVLTGHPNVSKRARAAVQEAAQALHYTPNRAARSLVTRRSDSVAFVVSETQERLFTDPFFVGVLRGAHAEVAARHRQMLFSIASSVGEREQLAQFVGGGHLDGVVLVSLHGDDALPMRLQQMGVPVVLAGRPYVDDGTLTYVDADNRGGACTATKFLVERGARHITTVAGPADMSASQDRLEGFRAGLRGSGQRMAAHRVQHGDFTLQGGAAAMARLLEIAPQTDGVFAASDLMAIGAIQAIEASGRRVPADVAVVGFDDVPAAMIAQPPLTTIRQPIEAMGRAAVDLLVHQIEGGTVRTAELLYEPELVVRSSTAPCRGDRVQKST
jgi:DNA-binding LacI/PurR family transcriptional regulator